MPRPIKSKKFSSFSTMLKSALGSRVDQNANDFIELMAPDGVMEFPYAPNGGIKRLNGRAALANYLATISDIIEIKEITNLKAHQTVDPEIVILEFSCLGMAVKTGQPYNQNYISVITTHEGKIVHYVDYWNPLIVLAAIGESDMPKDTSLQNNLEQRSTPNE